MITIKDIAKAAGVSPATVSNVLNKRDGVSYEKIRLVEDTALRMGYHIDKSASALRKGSTKIIALFLPTISEACTKKMILSSMKIPASAGLTISVTWISRMRRKRNIISCIP